MLLTNFQFINNYFFNFCTFFRHIDGHHKLIRWRVVIDGAIDGYSRLIVYLCCSTNNKAATVCDLFLQAVDIHGLPSRVRADFENVDVAQYMLCHPMRGINRGSMITGKSIISELSGYGVK